MAGHLFNGIETHFDLFRAAAMFISAARQRFTHSRGVHAQLRRFLTEGDADALVAFSRTLAECSAEYLTGRIADATSALGDALKEVRAERDGLVR